MTSSTATIMTSAWTLAREGALRFGGSVRAYFADALRQAWIAARKPARKSLSCGRNSIMSDLLFYPDVVGGGAVTPRVRVVTGYDTTANVRWESDCRSGSKRSGYLAYQLEEDRLYEIYSAENSSRGRTTLVSTYDGQTVELGIRAFEEAKRRLYPNGYELAQVRAEQARVAEEARQARLVIEERERLERMKVEAEKREAEVAARKAALADEAEKIEVEGQTTVDGLPLLKGTPKQVAWALRIRAAVQAREPKNPALTRGTTASYWIENYRSALPRF